MVYMDSRFLHRLLSQASARIHSSSQEVQYNLVTSFTFDSKIRQNQALNIICYLRLLIVICCLRVFINNRRIIDSESVFEL